MFTLLRYGLAFSTSHYKIICTQTHIPKYRDMVYIAAVQSRIKFDGTLSL